MLSDTELKYAIERGIIDVTDARKQIDMTKRKEILKEHEDMIWHSSDGHWYCYLPDNTKPRNRRKIKRVTREAIEKVLIEFYLKEKEQDREQKRHDEMTLEELYNEFMIPNCSPSLPTSRTSLSLICSLIIKSLIT